MGERYGGVVGAGDDQRTSRCACDGQYWPPCDSVRGIHSCAASLVLVADADVWIVQSQSNQLSVQTYGLKPKIVSPSRCSLRISRLRPHRRGNLHPRRRGHHVRTPARETAANMDIGLPEPGHSVPQRVRRGPYPVASSLTASLVLFGQWRSLGRLSSYGAGNRS